MVTETATQTAPAQGVTAIPLAQIREGALYELARFMVQAEYALDKQAKPDKQNEANQARQQLAIVGEEFKKIGMEDKHVDHARQNMLKEKLSGGEQDFMRNPKARMMSQLLTDGKGIEALSKFGDFAKKAGVQTIGGLNVDAAVGYAQLNADAVVSAKYLEKQNGPYIFASAEDIAAGGGGLTGQKNVVRITARNLKENLENNGTNDLSKILKMPVEATLEQKQEASAAGQAIKGGLSQDQAKRSQANETTEQTQTAARLAIAARAGGQDFQMVIGSLNSRQASFMGPNATAAVTGMSNRIATNINNSYAADNVNGEADRPIAPITMAPAPAPMPEPLTKRRSNSQTLVAQLKAAGVPVAPGMDLNFTPKPPVADLSPAFSA